MLTLAAGSHLFHAQWTAAAKGASRALLASPKSKDLPPKFNTTVPLIKGFEGGPLNSSKYLLCK